LRPTPPGCASSAKTACRSGRKKLPSLEHLFGTTRSGSSEIARSDSPSAQDSAQDPAAQVHLIGPLQSNKTARATELFHAIDAVDSLKIATRLDAAARALGKRLPILIEVKLSHEESKHGVSPAGLPALLAGLAPLENLIPAGLMTVPPWDDDPARARAYFPRTSLPARCVAGRVPHAHPALDGNVQRLRGGHRGGQHLRPHRHRALRHTAVHGRRAPLRMMGCGGGEN